MKKEKNGFTLAELLIVVAIIAVLIVIAIPVFSSQYEKAAEATDAANVRGQYAAEVVEAINTGAGVNTDGANKMTLKQKRDDWQNETFLDSLKNLGTIEGTPAGGGSAWVEIKEGGTAVTIHFEGGSGGSSGGSGGGESGGGESGGGSSQGNAATATAIGNKVVEKPVQHHNHAVIRDLAGNHVA